MSTRSLFVSSRAVSLSLALSAFSLSMPARADLASSSSASGTSTSGGDSGCTAGSQTDGERMCSECNPASTCGALGSSYNYTCTQSSSVQVWCTGPNPTQAQDQGEGGCAVRASRGESPWKGAVVSGAIAIAAAMYLRRRKS